MSTWFKREVVSKNRSSLNRGLQGKLIPIRRTQTIASQSVFARMINECRELGATEVFVGIQSRQAFEFIADGKTYSGELPLKAIEELKELLRSGVSISLEWEELDVKGLKVGLTTTGSSAVYCFSWREDVTEKPAEERDLSENDEEFTSEVPLVLIVDDDPRFSQILARILEEQGFQTLTASNGKEGLSILEEFDPALVVSDVHMPHLSGPEFLLESRKRGYDVPYLVLTNDEDALTEAELILLGASAFIKKSDDPRVLLAWCRRLTGLRRVT